MSNIFYDIDLNLKLDSRTKDIVPAVDSRAVNQRLANVILTQMGEIPYEPLIGTDVAVALFEIGWVAKEVITDSIERVIRDMFTEIDIAAIKAVEENLHYLHVTVVYKIRPDSTEHKFEMKLRLQ